MADVNQFLKAALEKQKVKAEKIEAKSPKKITKGVRPYNFDSEQRVVTDISMAPRLSDIPKPLIATEVETTKLEFKESRSVETINSTNVEPNLNTETINKIEKNSPLKEQNHIKFVSEEYEEGYSSVSKNLIKGFTRVPNEILFKVMNGEFEPREARVLLAIIRLSAGFGKSWVSVSAKYLADITDVPINHIFKNIKGLVAKGVLEKKVNSGNERKLSNQYKVLFDNKNSFLEYASEETGFSEKLENYLEKILVKAQKEIEKKSIRELIESGFNQEEIYEAIVQVKDRGMPGTQEKPNNPAAFLSKAGSRVFADIRKRSIKAMHNQQDTEATTEAYNKEEEEFRLIEYKFIQEYSDEKSAENKINELIDIHNIQGSGSIKLPYFVARKIALQKWFETKRV